MPRTATNPTTGERIAFIDGQWVPITRTATNPETGERIGFAGNQWVPLGSATPTPTPTPTPAPTPARPQEEEQGWGEWLADQALGTLALPVTAPPELARTAYGAVQSLAGLPGSFEAQVTAPGASQWERTLTKFDEIDRGEYTPPERLSESMQAYLRGQQSLYGGAPVSTPGVETAEDRAAREYAAASPAERRAIRANYEQRLVRDVNRVGEIAREQAARNERLAPYRPTVENLTDVRGPADLGTYVAGALGQAAPQLGVVMGTAALTRNPAATAAVSGAMAFDEGTSNRITYAMEQYADLPPAQQARAVARYLEDTNDVTAMVAIAQGALDLAGPVGTILKRQFVKELGEEVVARTAGEAVRQGLRRAPREVGEEFLTGGAQEVVAIAGERSLGEQQGDALTADNFLRVLNAAAAEGVGGLGGSAVFTGVDAVRATRAARAAPQSEVTAAIQQEFQQLAAREVAAVMAANPEMRQNDAVNVVMENAEQLLIRAATNVASRIEGGTDATAGAGMDVTGRGERGVDNDRGPVPPATDAEVAGETVGGGLGRTGTGVPVPDVGTRAGEPALAPITAAQVKATIPTIEQTFEANASDFEYTYNVTELNAEQKKQAARIVLQSPEVDPYDAIDSVLSRGARLRGAEGSTTTVEVGGRKRTIKTPATPAGAAQLATELGVTPTPPTAVEAELVARDQEVSQELLEPEVQTEPTVAETATVEKVATPEMDEATARELDMIDEELSLIAEQRAENAYEGEDPDTMADYEERIAELLARRKQLATAEAATAASRAALLDELGKKWEEASDLYNRVYRSDEQNPEGMSEKETEMFFRGHDKAWDDSQRAATNYFRASGNTEQLKFFLSQISNRTDAEQVELNNLVNSAINDDFGGPVDLDPNNPEDAERLARMMQRSRPGDVQLKSVSDFNQGAAKLSQPAPGQTFEDIGETPAPTELVNTPSSNDISALVDQLPETERVNVRARLDRIMARYEKNGDVKQLLDALESLRQDVDRRIDRDRAKRGRDRVRGFERAMEVIYRAERTGQLTPEAAGLVRWLLEQNPAIAEELAISIREGAGQRAAGQYNPAMRLATIFASNANDGTAVHEVLHHTERLMPEKVRDGIRAAWAQRIQSLIALADKTNNANMREVLGTIVQAYYGDTRAQEALKESFDSGDIPYSLYHLANPSEFWAVNATDLVGKRAKQTGWLGAARTWLSDLIETVKNFFGLPNDAAVIAGIKAIMAVESGTIRGQMLSTRTRDFMMYAGKAAHAANRSKLAEAQALEAAGALSGPTGTTRAKTGWFRGVDGEWRFEISDLGMKFKEGYTPQNLKEGRTYLLGQIIDHPELFKQYPDLQKINVVVSDAAGDAGGHWDAKRNEIVISNRMAKEISSYLDILAHELQHAVQTWEGFASGAHYKQYPLSLDAINKALSFLDKNNGQPLFMWGEYYRADRLGDMQNWLQHTRDTVGDRLQQDNDFLRSYGARRTEIATERRDRTRDAEDAWRNGNHPEAVKLRELRDARIAAANRMQAPSLSADERQAALAEYEVAQKAESAQAKYVRGLIDTGVVPLPDMRDLDVADDYLTGKRAEVFARRDELNDRLARVGVDKLMYYLTAGEVEARDTEQRREKLDEEREVTPPYVGERFGSPSDMITVNPYTGTSAAPPQGPPGAPEGSTGGGTTPEAVEELDKLATVKLTKAQIKRLETAAGLRAGKMSKMEERIVRSRKGGETADLAGKLMLLSRDKDSDVNLLTSLYDSVPPPVFQTILGALMTEDVVRLGTRAGLVTPQRIDELMRDGYMPYVNRLIRRAEKVSTMWADFASRFPEGAEALADVMFVANMFDVDPVLAPTATDYMKIDPKLQTLLAEQAATTDKKRLKALKGQITERRGEITKVYNKTADADGNVVFGWKDLSRADFGGGMAKQIFRMARDEHRFILNEHYRLLMDRIDNSGFDEDRATELKDAISKMFDKARERAIYFPVRRFGNYLVSVGKGGRGGFYLKESYSEARALARRLKREGETADIVVGDKRNNLRNAVTSSDAGKALKNIFDLIEGGTVDDMDMLKDNIFQMYLTALPEADMRRRFIHREFVTGFSTDVLRAYSSTAVASANQLGRLAYKYKFDQLFEEAKTEVEENPSSARLATIPAELEMRVQGIMSPPEDNWVDWLNSIGSKATFYLLMSAPKTALVNLTQLPIVGLPTLSAEFGEPAAYAMAARYKGTFLTTERIANPFMDRDGNVSLQMPRISLQRSRYISGLRETDPDRYAAFMEAQQYMDEHEVAESTYASGTGIYELSRGPTDTFTVMQSLRKGKPISAARRATANAINAMGALFHGTERINREIMFFSSFELAYERALKEGKTAAEATPEAIRLANKLTNDAMFDFSGWNKSRASKSRLGRLPLQLSSYRLQMTSLLFRSFVRMLPFMNKEGKLAAARVFFGIGAMTTLFAGIRASQFYALAMLGYGLYEFVKGLADDDEEDKEQEIAQGYLNPETVERELLKYADEHGHELGYKDMDYFIRAEWIPETFGAGGTLATRFNIPDSVATKLEAVADMGLPAVAGVDISNSVSLGDLWHMSDVRSDDPEAAFFERLGRLIGPVGAIPSRGLRAINEFNQGNVERGFEALSPAILSNYLKSERFQEEGLVIGANRDIVLKEPDFYDTYTSTMQALGFAEAETSRNMQLDIQAGDIEDEISAARSQLITDRYRAARALEQNPSDETIRELSEVERAIDIYNLNYPSNSIGAETLSRSYEQRAEDAASKEYGLGMDQNIPIRQPLFEERIRRMVEEGQ